jgi:SPP1 gp7 family putative phage head morphogenesis protein
VTLSSTKQLNALNDFIQKTVEEHYKDNVIPDVKKIFDDVIEDEILWNERVINGVIAGNLAVPNSELAAKRAFNKAFQGKRFETWFKQLGATKTRQIIASIRGGFVTGTVTNEIVKQVEGLMLAETRDIKTLVRSSLQHAAHEARRDLFNSNKDIIEEKQWVSILDSRTTAHICGPRDGLRYDSDDNPIGHSLGWEAGPGSIHFNCRSTFVPIIKGVSPVGERPAVGAGRNYERGDNKTGQDV